MTGGEVALFGDDGQWGPNFSYGELPLRIYMLEGEPWFIGSEACAILGIANVSDAVARLDEDEKRQVSRGIGVSEGVTKPPNPGDSMWLVSEPGLYSLILRSNKPEAKEFKRYLIHEVLPQIRKTGQYRKELTRVELLEMALDAEKAKIAAVEQLAITTARADELNDHLTLIGPDAGAWQTLAAAGDDWLVEDVARMLNRDPAIETGSRRLWDWLFNEGIMTRARKIPQPKQDYIDRGFFRTRLVSYPDPFSPTPKTKIQVRITLKGISWIHEKLGGVNPVESLIHPNSDDE